MPNGDGRSYNLTIDGNSQNGREFRVLIVDEHPIVRHGVASLLTGRMGFVVCGECDSLSESMRLIQKHCPHLVLLDLSLQNGSGLDVIKEVTAIDQAIKFCVLSMHSEYLFAERALRAGADGFISKNLTLDEVMNAIRRVLAGRVYLSESMTNRMLSRSLGGNELMESSPIESLSDRELEIFKLIGHGVSTRRIAKQLFLSPKTVETYRENIKVKLNLANATELIQHTVTWVLDSGGAIDVVNRKL